MTDNIIKFPRASKRKKNLNEVLVDRLTDTSVHVNLGHVPFTCPECKSRSSFDFNNVIFKSIVFHCAACGHGYKVSNPMFSDTILSNKTK